MSDQAQQSRMLQAKRGGIAPTQLVGPMTLVHRFAHLHSAAMTVHALVGAHLVTMENVLALLAQVVITLDFALAIRELSLPSESIALITLMTESMTLHPDNGGTVCPCTKSVGIPGSVSSIGIPTLVG